MKGESRIGRSMVSKTTFVMGIAVGLLSRRYMFSMPHPYEGLRAVEISEEKQRAINRVGQPKEFAAPFLRNEELRKARRLFEGQIHGSESVAVRPNGELVMLDKFGYLHTGRLGDGDGAPDVLDEKPALYIGPGRPLGFHVVDQGAAVLVCDSVKGLIKVELEGKSRGAITVLANRVSGGTEINYANDLDVAKNGTVFFSSSTEGAVSINTPLGFYDTMRSYMLNAMRGDATGRLLAYHPQTRRTTEVFGGLFYANGVAVAADQSFVAVVETSTFRVLRYWLRGEKQGTVDTLIDGLPGAPDGITASSDGNFWLCLIVPASPVLKILGPLRWARQLLSHLIGTLTPLIAKKWGCVVKVSPSGEVLEALFDPEGDQVSMVSAVTESESEVAAGPAPGPGGRGTGHRLFLGNLGGSYVSVLQL
jgi:sugar lactone lactonase YvrE